MSDTTSEPTTTEPVLEAMSKAAEKSMSQVASHDEWLRGILRAALEATDPTDPPHWRWYTLVEAAGTEP